MNIPQLNFDRHFELVVKNIPSIISCQNVLICKDLTNLPLPLKVFQTCNPFIIVFKLSETAYLMKTQGKKLKKIREAEKQIYKKKR